MLLDGFLLGMLGLAVVYDVRSRRIPNWIVFSGMVFALLYHLYLGGCSGLFYSLKGLLVGIALLILPFAMGGMGAGDVKLLGMVGALKGSIFVFNCFIAMALWGGIIAIILLLIRRRLQETLWRLGLGLFIGCSVNDCIEQSNTSIYYPYGVAIGLGVLTCCGGGWW
ncbi:MAG: prepilin peptidase [Syntrophomonas sp.]